MSYAIKVEYSREQYFINYNHECMDCRYDLTHNQKMLRCYHPNAKLVPEDLRQMKFLTLLKLKLQGLTWKKDGIRVVVTKQALESIRSYKK